MSSNGQYAVSPRPAKAGKTGNPNGKMRAVFYDVDGTLLKSNIVYVYLYFALRHARLSHRAQDFFKLLTLTPAYKVVDLFNRKTFNKLFYKNYKGVGEDRLKELGRDLAEEMIIPNLYHDALDRVQTAKQMGLTQVLVTGSIPYVIEPLKEYLGIDYALTNHLVIDNYGNATGELKDPILAGEGKRTAMHRFADALNIDLAHSYGFADSIGDKEMLETVGYPVVVNPDRRLKKLAARRGWMVDNFS